MSEEEFREVKEIEQRVNVLTQSRAGGDGSEDVDDEVRERMGRLEEKVANVQVSSGEGGVSPSAVAEAPAVKRLDERVAT